MLVFRSVLVPLKAAAAEPAQHRRGVRRDGHGLPVGLGRRDLIGLESTVPIVSFIPMFMFAILFGLSMDYEVFLLSRVREEYLAPATTRRRRARHRRAPARVITSAALIMVSVFLGFVLGDDPTTKMMGLGLATAIFLDATVVRLVLVPADHDAARRRQLVAAEQVRRSCPRRSGQRGHPAWAPTADAADSRRAHPSGETNRRRRDMTSTTAPATFLPSPRRYDGGIAAQLRQVTTRSDRHRRYQRLGGEVSLEFRRGEVTTLLSRYDGSAGRLLDLLDGRAPASRGSVRVAGHELSGLDPRELFRLRREQVARVQPGYGIYPKLTVRQNLVVAQRRSGRRADLGWVDDGGRGPRAAAACSATTRAGGGRSPGALGGRPEPGGPSRAAAGRRRHGPARVAGQVGADGRPPARQPAGCGWRRSSPRTTRSPRPRPTGSCCSTGAGSSTTPGAARDAC